MASNLPLRQEDSDSDSDTGSHFSCEVEIGRYTVHIRRQGRQTAELATADPRSTLQVSRHNTGNASTERHEIGIATDEITTGNIAREIPANGITYELPADRMRSELPANGVTIELPADDVVHELPGNRIAHELQANIIASELSADGIANELPTTDAVAAQVSVSSTNVVELPADAARPTDPRFSRAALEELLASLPRAPNRRRLDPRAIRPSNARTAGPPTRSPTLHTSINTSQPQDTSARPARRNPEQVSPPTPVDEHDADTSQDAEEPDITEEEIGEYYGFYVWMRRNRNAQGVRK